MDITDKERLIQGIIFDDVLKGPLKLQEWDNKNWLFQQHPEGQWVSYRIPTLKEVQMVLSLDKIKRELSTPLPEPEVIDRKFNIIAFNPCNKKVYTEKNALLFSAQDKALLPALYAYHDACIDLSCEDTHIESIELLIKRVRRFQHHTSKIPDTDTSCEVDRCIGGLLK